MRVSVGDFLLSRLRDAGITEVIGVPGDFNLNLIEQIDAMEGIRFVGACNELNAAYAADGYARSRGLGALLTTYGVGELSALNGIAGAAAEHVPVVSIAGAPPLYATVDRYELHHSMADGDFGNMLGSVGQFTATAVRVTPHNVVEEVDRALHIALREKRPVHIQIPSDITHLTIEAQETPFDASWPFSDPERLSSAVDVILTRFAAAKRPALLIDLDADRHRFASGLQAFAEKTATPYAQLSTGKAILNEQSPLFAGTYNGENSSAAVRDLVEGADFLLTTTPRFIEGNSGSFTQKLPTATVVDIGDQHVSVGGSDYSGLTGRELLDALVEGVRPCVALSDAVALATAVPGADDVAASAALSQERLWPRLARFIREGDVVIAEAGTSSIGLGSQPMPANVRYVNSGIWGSIGYTLPALLGSLLADTTRRHVLFIGDGSFQLTAQELSTILREKLAPIIFLVNNRGYTIERWILGMNSAYNDVAAWDYRALPKVFAPETQMSSYSVHTEGELEEVLERVADAQTGAFIELHLDPFDAPAGLKIFGPRTAEFDYGPRGPRNM